MSDTRSIMLVGVGGQGIILASEVVCQALLNAGLQVKKSEVHGMAQRGGSVRTDVRFGTEVHAPLIAAGEADLLVAFEQMEALRYAHFLRPGGEALVSTERIIPTSTLTGPHPYPADVAERLAERGARVHMIDAPALARQAGNPRTAGIVMIGALAARLEVPTPAWRRAITALVPERYRDVNLAAFRLGRKTTPAG